MTVNDIQSSLISATENITSPQCDIGNISCNNLTATTLVESDEANFSTYNFIVGVGDELDVNTLTASLATINTINVSGTANISTGNFSTIDVIDGNIDTLTNGKITSTDRIIINNIQPTLYLKDTNHRSGMIHMNNNKMYFLVARRIANLGVKSMGNGRCIYIPIPTKHFRWRYKYTF